MGISKYTKTAVALALITIGLVGIAAIGAAETTEFTNETIEFDADENVTVDVDWNDSIDDPDATADVTFYNATEYDDDPETATVVLDDAIDADEGNTTSTEYTDADGLEDETEYRLLVEGDDTEVDDVTIDDGTVGGFFPGSDGTPGFGVGVAIVALVTAGVVARARGDL